MKRTDITGIFPDATEEQINTIMNLNGADINKAKGDLETLRGQLTTAQTDLAAARAAAGDPKKLQEALDNAATLQAELDKLKAANNIRDIRDKVSAEHKIPANLLTGETEEACVEQAKAIAAYAASIPGYPAVKDNGEVQHKAAADAWQAFNAQLSD